ncbi:MAG: tRNA dihydrouridine synthase [Kiritimatiellia bacterium]
MRYVLAPLAGFTDAPFRRLCFEGGADLTYTEMVSAAGLAHGSSPTRHLMETMPGEGPVALQLFGAKETDVAAAADLIEREVLSRKPHPFVELNLNAGCPMAKVTREGAGAKLIEDPAKVGRLLRAMTEHTSLPVTLKTRLGPHPRRTNVFELLDAAESAGAKGLIVHARHTSQLHGGPVDLETLAEIVRRAKIPVTGNGSVVDAPTAAAMARTGVAAVMVGRAALANPAIFRALRERRAPGLPDLRFFGRHLAYLLQFRDLLAERYPADHIPSPDGFASVKAHVHLFRYFNGRPGAAALRAKFNAVRTLAEIEAVVASIPADSAP